MNIVQHYIYHYHILTAESVLGTSIAYLANSDTIENGGIGPLLIQIPESVQPKYNIHHTYGIVPSGVLITCVGSLLC